VPRFAEFHASFSSIDFALIQYVTNRRAKQQTGRPLGVSNSDSQVFNVGPLDRARQLKPKHLRVERQLELGAPTNVERLPKAVALARKFVIADGEFASA
jgi:hypothetical protein